MSKKQANLFVDEQAYDLFKNQYPGRVSELVEDFMRQMTGAQGLDDEGRIKLVEDIESLNQKLKTIDVELSAKKAKLEAFDKQLSLKKEKLDSEAATNKKENYFELPKNLRMACGNIHAELVRLNLDDIDYPIFPFDIYYQLTTAEFKDFLYNICDRDDLLDLHRLLNIFYREYRKEHGEGDAL